MFIILSILFVAGFFVVGFLSKNPSPQQRGEKAESLAAKKLKALPQDEYIVLNDLLLPVSYKTAQIDHVVLSLYGVYVIETKNYSGSVTGTEKSEFWEQYIHGFRYKMGNALRQNENHITAIRRCANIKPEIPVYNFVAFGRDTEFNIRHESGQVVYIKDLVPTILRMRAAEPVYTFEQIRIKADLLLGKNITDTESRKAHNATANAARSNKNNKIEAGICPRCGGQLIQRKGKYGTFYGCSNYPNCDFTINSLRTDHEDWNNKIRRSRWFK